MSNIPNVPLFEIAEQQPQSTGLQKAGLPKRRPRKIFANDNLEPIQDIFGFAPPHQIGFAEDFLEHHPHLRSPIAYPFAAPKVGIGIEVEVENVLKVDPNVQLYFWVMKPDGSLRNGGQEFITPGVISVSLAEVALRQLFEGLNHNVDFSSRTSIHVHMDVHQINLDQLLGLLLTYTTVENLLFKFVGNNRRTNIFCVPITETGLFDYLAGGSPKKVLHAIDQYWSKYTALNLLPITTQGSIEFRHMPGTHNVENILRWIDLITRLKLYVYKYSLQNIISQISELNSTSRYKEFVENVFGNMMSYIDDKNLLTDMERPVYLVKNSALSNGFNETVVKSASHESHLGQRLGGWMTALSAEQIGALQTLAVNHDINDLEEFFQILVRSPQQYLKGWPSEAAILKTVLTPVAAAQLPEEPESTDFISNLKAKLDKEQQTMAEYNKIIATIKLGGHY